MIHTIDNPKEVKYSFSPEELNFTGVVKSKTGTIAYYVNGKLHREDGPATISVDGSKIYYLNGKFHRVDGPAAIGADGAVEYWVNHKLHREDGPARVFADGATEYWVNDEQLHISTDQGLKDHLALRTDE